jgi:DNA-binding IclR family transcriptional regulator
MKKPRYYSQVLHRVMQILDAFDSSPDGTQFTNLANRLKLHKSTLYRLLEAMRGYDLIELDSKGRYHLGFKLFELGAIVTSRFEVVRYASPVLRELSLKTGETAQLCVLDDMHVVYLAKVDGKQRFYVPSTVGGRNPAYCTGVGKAILAGLSASNLEDYLRQWAKEPVRAYTKKTVTNRKDLESQLEQIRIRGYSVDDEEISEGLRCVGAPVRDFSGEGVAGISIAGPAVRVTKKAIPNLAKHVVEAAEEVSRQLGYRTATKAKQRE